MAKFQVTGALMASQEKRRLRASTDEQLARQLLTRNEPELLR
jgi:hypothetical protein